MMRTFLYAGHDLFGQGVASLLGRQAGLALVGQETDSHRAIARISALRPDVVIVSRSHDSPEQGAVILYVLQNHLTDRVIGLDPGDNTISVYRAEQKPFRQLQDLTDVIFALQPSTHRSEIEDRLPDRQVGPCQASTARVAGLDEENPKGENNEVQVHSP